LKNKYGKNSRHKTINKHDAKKIWQLLFYTKDLMNVSVSGKNKKLKKKERDRESTTDDKQ